MAHAPINNDTRTLIRWLFILNAAILVMIAIGGTTRLTGSGLSMVDWNPIMGVIPPTSELEWQETFDRYKGFPEYTDLRPNMTLPQFKQIFFWEYLHRVFGRLIGLVWFIPFIYFLFTNTKARQHWLSLLIIGLLIAFQGILGWYMVKSGLINLPYVSHYRLAAHLSTAFFLYGYIVWWIARMLPEEERRMFDQAERSFVRMLTALLFFIILQIVYGAFVAGRDAGLVSNTYPKMMGDWIPSGMFHIKPFWRNLVENNTFLHYFHRALGTALLFTTIALWFRAQRFRLSNRQKLGLNGLFTFMIFQFILGVATVVSGINLQLAVAHQVNACVLLGTIIFSLQALSVPKQVTSRRS